MKTCLFALLLSLSSLAWAQPQVIAFWAQNDNNLPGGGFGFQPGDFPQAADVGSGSLRLVNYDQSAGVNANGDTVYQCIQSFGGTTVNTQTGFVAGGSLSPQGCAETSNNGMHIQIEVATTHLEDIQVSWAWRATSSGFNSRTFSWSLDGENFNVVGTDSGTPTSFELQSYDLAAIDAINNQPQVFFRITLDGATGGSGNNRFDNITVSGAPIEGSASEAIPYEIAFTTDPYTAGWTRQNLSGLTTWNWSSQFNNVSFSGFGGSATGCVPTESWFISPGFDLDGQDNERLFVDLQRGFGGDDPLTLWFSSDYSGQGDPGDATWTLLDTITADQFASNNTTVTFGPYLALREQSGVGYFAARGLYASGQCSTWRMMGVRIDIEDEGSPFACSVDPDQDETVTRIHAIQGVGAESPLVGEAVEVQAVVVGSFQDTASFEIGGFFLQEPDDRTDDNLLSSEGLFIAAASASVALPSVNVGDEVRVRGVVREQFGQTELFQLNAIELCAENRLDQVSPVELEFPVTDLEALEAVEGMWVRLPQAMAVTEVFNAARFAEFAVAPDRLLQPTQIVSPGAAAQALQSLNDRSRLIIDQGRTGSYRTPFQPGLDGSALNAANPIRVGYRLQPGFEGVMGFGFSNYRLFALQPAQFDELENPRSDTPPALPAGNLRVASYNLENLFLTLDAPGATCGPGTLSCRGASTESELSRQLSKLSEAILALDADLIGLNEVENDADDATLALLVDVLNADPAVSDWAFIPTGYKGTDAIKNAIIYRSSRVVPFAQTAILDSSVSVTPPFDSSRQRPVLSQAFRHLLSGEVLTVSVFHLRSKSCGANAAGANDDQGDGQGCWNALRTDSVAAFLNWLETDPMDAGTDRHLVLGDFNAYAQEDPLQLLDEAGFVSETIRANGNDPSVYNFVFQGQSGSLDHLLASPALSESVLGAASWSINADEIPAFSYAETLPSSSLPKPADFFIADAFRSSDHDPLLAALVLNRAEALDFLLSLGQGVQSGTLDFGSGQSGQVLLSSGRLINAGSQAAELRCQLEGPDAAVFSTQPDVIDLVLAAGAALELETSCRLPVDGSGGAFEAVLSCTLDSVPAAELALTCARGAFSEPVPVPVSGRSAQLLLILLLLALGLLAANGRAGQLAPKSR